MRLKDGNSERVGRTAAHRDDWSTQVEVCDDISSATRPCDTDTSACAGLSGPRAPSPLQTDAEGGEAPHDRFVLRINDRGGGAAQIVRMRALGRRARCHLVSLLPGDQRRRTSARLHLRGAPVTTRARVHRDAERERVSTVIADEDVRIAHELGDTVIRGLFSTGLRLHSLIPGASEPVREELIDIIGDIDKVIREIRNVIFECGPTE